MTTIVIILFCSLLLVAYLFNLTASKTKIPSVILLLILGWSIKQGVLFLGLSLPDFSSFLPLLATIGLVLIVLEGSLELKLNKSRLGLVKISFLSSLLSMIVLAVLFSSTFHYFGNYSFKVSLINSIPLCVISSAIAIPSVTYLTSFNREFIIYESSLSDIFGVLFFNFMTLNAIININSFWTFGLQLVIMIFVSVVATIGLSFLLSKIDHHIKFVPIILLIILIYEVSKIFHLPALIFILIFGLSIGNLGLFKGFKWMEELKKIGFKDEIKKFKDLTIEGAFLIRALFFILFGYLLDSSEIFYKDTLLWSFGVVFAIFFIRALFLKMFKIPLNPLFYVAPRGLITILLFISIDPSQSILFVNKSLIIQVIILTTIIMSMGLMVSSKSKLK